MSNNFLFCTVNYFKKNSKVKNSPKYNCISLMSNPQKTDTPQDSDNQKSFNDSNNKSNEELENAFGNSDLDRLRNKLKTVMKDEAEPPKE